MDVEWPQRTSRLSGGDRYEGRAAITRKPMSEITGRPALIPPRAPARKDGEGARPTGDKATLFEPAPSIGFLFNDSARIFRRTFNARTRATGITALQWRVLACLLRNEPARQSWLAEIIEVEPITLSRMIARLANAGFVERRPDDSDRRAKLLFLTPRGHELLDCMHAVAAAIADEATEGLSLAERDQLIELVERVRANLSRLGK